MEAWRDQWEFSFQDFATSLAAKHAEDLKRQDAFQTDCKNEFHFIRDQLSLNDRRNRKHLEAIEALTQQNKEVHD